MRIAGTCAWPYRPAIIGPAAFYLFYHNRDWNLFIRDWKLGEQKPPVSKWGNDQDVLEKIHT